MIAQKLIAAESRQPHWRADKLIPPRVACGKADRAAMKPLLTTAILLILTSSGLAEDKPSDRETIQGTWKFISVTQNGKDIEAGEEGTVTFEESRFSGEALRKMSGRFALDPEGSPKQMDMIIGQREGEEVTLHMIYKLREHELTICTRTVPGLARPTEFKAEAGCDSLLVVMERIEKEAR